MFERPALTLCMPILLAVVALLGAQAARPSAAHAGCILGLLCKPDPGAAAPGPGTCPDLGSVDRNPTDAPVAPRLGVSLIPRRADGRPQIGFDGDQGAVPPSEDLALHRRVGSTLQRRGLEWGVIEATRNSFRWNGYDEIYCRDLQSGVRPLFVVWTSPVWAAQAPLRCSKSPCLLPPNRAYENAFSGFMTRAAIRYPKAIFEIWNEPNLDDYWGGPAEPERYTELLKAAYTGAKRGDPNSIVLGGALSNNTANAAGDMSFLTFLDRMYDAGAAGAMDAVSFHPYPVWADPSRSLTAKDFDWLTELLTRRGEYPRRHVWATELGASTRPVKKVTDSEQFSPQGQADTLWRAYEDAGSRPNVDALVFHDLIEASAPSYAWVKPKDGGGRVYPNPVYCKFASELVAPLDCSTPVPLR